MNSSGVPHTENASSASSVTAPIAPPKSPLAKQAPTFSLNPSGKNVEESIKLLGDVIASF